MDDSIIYQRSGVKIVFDINGITIKKNGLTVEIPKWMVEDMIQEFEIELSRVIEKDLERHKDE